MAGLIALHDTGNITYLRVSHDEALGKCLGIIVCDNGAYIDPLAQDVSIDNWERVYLKLVINYDELRFSYSPDGESWLSIGPVLDASKLSDEYSKESPFTGAFVGICAQDLSGRRKHADFDFFTYRELS